MTDDLYLSEEVEGADGHDGEGLGLGNGDEALDFLIYQEITKERNRNHSKRSGCLGPLLFMASLALFLFWKLL